jgi:GrpB-like predicted nucleotidyltransferase (UPF0157 family)
MNPTQLLAGMAAGLVLGGTTGFLLGRSAPAVPTAHTPPASRLTANTTDAGDPSAHSPQPDSSAAHPMPATPTAIELTELEDLLESLQGGSGGMGAIRSVANLSERLSVSNLPMLAEAIFKGGNSFQQGPAAHFVLTAFAEKDPQAAWAFANTLPAGQQRQTALMLVAQAIASKDPTRAMTLAGELNNTQLERQIRSTAIMHLAQKNPRAALDLALREQGEEDFSVGMIFSNWVRRDPEAAKAAAANIEGSRGEQARLALLSALAQNDPRAAWSYAQSLPQQGSGHRDGRTQIIQSWAQSDPSAALEAATSMPAGPARSSAITAAVSAWGQQDPSAAVAYAAAISDSTLRSDVLRNLSSSGQIPSEELFTILLDHMPPGDNFQSSISSVLSRWAGEDPAAAAKALLDLPPGRAFSQGASQVASGWAARGPLAEVVDWARQLPEGEARRSALSAAFGRAAQNDPRAAVKTLDGLTSEDRSAAIRELSSTWSRTDPQGALQWASSLTDPDERRRVVHSAVGQWANAEPEQAAAYAARLPDDQRKDSLQAAVDRWASKDVEAAGAWLAKQPASFSRDGAAAALARKIAIEDPETAMSWAAAIVEEQPRNRQTEQLARDWIRQDPASARAWIGRSNLPADMRQRLLN